MCGKKFARFQCLQNLASLNYLDGHLKRLPHKFTCPRRPQPHPLLQHRHQFQEMIIRSTIKEKTKINNRESFRDPEVEEHGIADEERIEEVEARELGGEGVHGARNSRFQSETLRSQGEARTGPKPTLSPNKGFIYFPLYIMNFGKLLAGLHNLLADVHNICLRAIFQNREIQFEQEASIEVCWNHQGQIDHFRRLRLLYFRSMSVANCRL